MPTVPGDRTGWRPVAVVLLGLLAFVIAPGVAVLLPPWVEGFPPAADCGSVGRELAAAKAVEEVADPWTAIGAVVSLAAAVGWWVSLRDREPVAAWEGALILLALVAALPATWVAGLGAMGGSLEVLWFPGLVAAIGILNSRRLLGRLLAVGGLASFLLVGAVATTGWGTAAIC